MKSDESIPFQQQQADDINESMITDSSDKVLSVSTALQLNKDDNGNENYKDDKTPESIENMKNEEAESML